MKRSQDKPADQEADVHYLSPPEAIGAEQGLIGAAMVNREVTENARSVLAGDEFFDPLHQAMWDRLLIELDAGRPTTPLALAKFFADVPLVRNMTGPQYLMHLTAQTMCTPASAADYAAEIADACRRRRLILDLEDARKAAFDPAADLAATQAAILDAVERQQTGTGGARGLLPKIVNPADWQDRPITPRGWAVIDWIPTDEVTLLYGDGATGKSTLALMLMIARATGHRWLGLETKPGATLYVSCEDDAAEVHRRIAAMLKSFGPTPVALSDLGNLHILDLVGQDAILAQPNRDNPERLQPTPLYHELSRAIRKTGADLVVLDSLADVFAGNENDRQHARQFVRLFKAICRKINVSVVLLAHPSIASMSAGNGMSGSTAWSNSARSRLYFERPQGEPPDTNRRRLSRKKINNAAAGEFIDLQYASGAFVPLDDAGAGGGKEAREARTDAVFLDLLRWHATHGMDVFPTNGGHRSAPTMFAKHEGASGITAAEFRAAMQRLLTAGRISVEGVGPPSRRVKRIVEAPR